MSRRSGRGAGVEGNEFPFFDEPEGRRRRAKKRHDTYRKSSDEAGRSRRPHYEDDEPDWEDDYEDADWQASDDEELGLAGDLDDDGEWDEGAGWDSEDDDESDGEDDWRSRDDR